MENAALEITTDVRQSEEYARFMEKIGWKVVELSWSVFGEVGGKLLVFIRRIGPVSIAKIQRVERLPEGKEFDELLKQYRVVMCKLEPIRLNNDQRRSLKINGFKQDNWPLQASKTLRVSLVDSEDKILESFNKDARYCLRKLLVVGCKLLVNDFENFYEIWRKANKIKGLWTPSKKDFLALVESFGEKCFCVTLNDLGGCLVLMHQKTAYYFYSGTLPEGKKYDLPYGVVWEAMKIAKKRGMKIWDFEGIYDPRWPNNDWKGFSHFKKSFGKTEIELPGCFTMWRWPF